MTKVRVNITVDKDMLLKAKKKLGLFGGKVSTLIDAYLKDFVESFDEKVGEGHKVLIEKLEELDSRLKKVEKKI
ncbi:MAG TPA: hypothetical protein VJK51_02045 [Candidatus Nanoarchaeia archaeon]|nr:hypothetical protein [Candidatus Nanoarchaeia archaeon]